MASRKTASKPPRRATRRLATRLEQATKAAIKVLRREKAPHALIGGIALGLRAAPRATQDVDLAVALSDAAAERLIHAFQVAGFQIDAVLINKRDQSLATVRLHQAGSTTLIDLLISFCGIETDIVESATSEMWGGLTLPVVRTGHLIAMKLLANRKQDQADLENLIRDISKEERARALRAVAQITAAGLGGRRDLVRELEVLLSSATALTPHGFELMKRGKKR